MVGTHALPDNKSGPESDSLVVVVVAPHQLFPGEKRAQERRESKQEVEEGRRERSIRPINLPDLNNRRVRKNWICAKWKSGPLFRTQREHFAKFYAREEAELNENVPIYIRKSMAHNALFTMFALDGTRKSGGNCV